MAIPTANLLTFNFTGYVIATAEWAKGLFRPTDRL